MAGTEDPNDTDSSSGFKRFFRKILPTCSFSSSINSNTSATEYVPSQTLSHYDTWERTRQKRKSSFLRNQYDSEESDIEEDLPLPSSKRQRITVSAMQRLFAKFTLSDTEPTNSTHVDTIATGDTKTVVVSADQNRIQDITIPDQPRNSNPFATTVNNVFNNNNRTVNNNNVNHISNKNDNSNSDSSTNCNKRQVDTLDGEETSSDGHTNRKAKKTRTLKRGLRLCSNITCYIEQVIYN